jgi:hypothetical protein
MCVENLMQHNRGVNLVAPVASIARSNAGDLISPSLRPPPPAPRGPPALAELIAKLRQENHQQHNYSNFYRLANHWTLAQARVVLELPLTIDNGTDEDLQRVGDILTGLDHPVRGISDHCVPSLADLALTRIVIGLESRELTRFDFLPPVDEHVRAFVEASIRWVQERLDGAIVVSVRCGITCLRVPCSIRNCSQTVCTKHGSGQAALFWPEDDISDDVELHFFGHTEGTAHRCDWDDCPFVACARHAAHTCTHACDMCDYEYSAQASMGAYNSAGRQQQFCLGHVQLCNEEEEDGEMCDAWCCPAHQEHDEWHSRPDCF